MDHKTPSRRLELDILDTGEDAASSVPMRDGDSDQPWIGVHFACCGVYRRVYRRGNVRFYVARCPKCLRTLRIRVGADGINTRIVRVVPTN